MTFGQLVAHIVQTNDFLCAAISGTNPPMTPAELKKLSDTDPKDMLVAAIKQSFTYCTEGLGKVQDSTASYLRLNGILPPTAQPKQ